MTETPKQKVIPSNPNEGLKALEKRLGHTPTVREQLDTVENFRSKLEQLKKVLNSAENLVDKRQLPFTGEHVSAEEALFLKTLEIISGSIAELKESKAPVSPNDILELAKMEQLRNDIIIIANKRSSRSK